MIDDVLPLLLQVPRASTVDPANCPCKGSQRTTAANVATSNGTGTSKLGTASKYALIESACSAISVFCMTCQTVRDLLRILTVHACLRLSKILRCRIAAGVAPCVHTLLQVSHAVNLSCFVL